MTLIEAIKSGKRFKRADWERYYYPDPSRSTLHLMKDSGLELPTLRTVDILADDWEIEGGIEPLDLDHLRKLRTHGDNVVKALAEKINELVRKLNSIEELCAQDWRSYETNTGTNHNT